MAKKILIVDDNETMSRLLANELKEEGYNVVTANTGTSAVNTVVSEKPDIVIMDIMLPDMQGSDAVKQMQQRVDAPSNLKVIFLSGIVLQDTGEDQKLRVGDKYYPALPKPIDLEKLLKMLL